MQYTSVLQSYVSEHWAGTCGVIVKRSGDREKNSSQRAALPRCQHTLVLELRISVQDQSVPLWIGCDSMAGCVVRTRFALCPIATFRGPQQAGN